MAEDPDGYMGCLEARGEYPKRRACYDDSCKCRQDCQLWTSRADEGLATRAMTWRAHWRSFESPCDYFLPANPHTINNPIAL